MPKKKTEMFMRENKDPAAGVGLTAAVLVRAISTVRLFVALVTSWDALAITDAFKVLRCALLFRAFGSCSDE